MAYLFFIGDKLLVILVVCPQNGTAVVKGRSVFVGVVKNAEGIPATVGPGDMSHL